jgi:hypothetical protein
MSTEPITRELIKSWSVEQMKREVRDPARLAEINAFLATPEASSLVAEIVAEIPEVPVVDPPALTPEEQAAADAAAAEQARIAAQVEADRVVAEKVVADAAASEAAREAKALKEAGITVYRDDTGNITKLVQEYQADDEHKNPIGRSTHLEAHSWVELSQKQKEAHTQATRAFHRLKTQKTTFNREQVVGPVLMTDTELIQAAEDLKSDNREKSDAADRKIRADQILKDQQKLTIDRENAHQKQVAYEWMTRHISDFTPCEANSKILSAYLKDNDLEWSVDNLELAFAATESQLAPKEASVVAVPVPELVDNPPAAVPQEPAPVPAAAITPAPVVAAPEVPAVPAPAVNPQAPVARPGVNAGLIPGQQTGQRPLVKPAGLTKKDIKAWTPEQMRKEMKNPARLAEINRVLAAR